MAKSNRREAFRQGLKDRTRESQDRKEDSGKFKSIFKQDLENVEFWKPEVADHIIDIVPYIAGKNDPHVKEGQPQYVLDLWRHGNIGVNEDNYVCLARNYNKPCPICEHQSLLRKEEDYDEDLVDSLNPKRRVIYNIICYDTKKEEEKGVQVWEVAHFFMEDKIVPLSKDRRTGEPIPFSDPDTGKSISFEIKKSSFKNKKGETVSSVEFIGHKFEDRPDDYVISDEDLDDAQILDEIIHIPTYEELYEIYWEEEYKPESDSKFDNADEQRSSRFRGGNRTAKPKDDDSNKEEKGSGNRCPGGGSYGEDLDQLNHCNECDIYDDCVNRNSELSNGNKESEQEEKQDEKKDESKTKGRTRIRRRSRG